MCGIWAVIGSFEEDAIPAMVKTANSVQGHRGPDGRAYAVMSLRDGRKVVLGHQRLSIIELSEAGDQPMTSKHTGAKIAFNGELYNYIELARKLSIPPSSGSDTEVLLGLCDEVGVERALSLANGMWAFVHVSPEKSEIHIARDRLGKKPLYIWSDRNRLIVASELKTVAALAGVRFKVNRQVLADYVDYGLQDVTDQSWLSDVRSLPAGAVATVGRPGTTNPLTIRKIWELTPTTTLKSPEESFRQLFQESIKLRLRADVAVGATVSGGLDSSLILSEMVRQLGGPENVTAISAISPGEEGDESIPIERVCRALGVNSRTVEIAWDPNHTIELMKKVTWHNDSPLGSFSNIAFYELMRLARQLGIKVVLSGQGADESFCGYRKYFYWAIREQMIQFRPDRALANVVGSALNGTVLAQFSLADAARYMPKLSKQSSFLSNEVRSQTNRLPLGIGGKTVLQRQADDISRYSVPFLTHYEDRNSMAHGVEVRLPFLDYRVVEFGLGLPLHQKIRNGWTKHLLRSAYRGALPDEVIFRRDKKGFTVPQRQMMRKELRKPIDDLLHSDALMYRLGLMDREAVLHGWSQFLSGDESIWDRKMFAPWALETWLNAFSPFLE